MNNDFHHFQKYQKLNEYQFINNMFFGAKKKETNKIEDTSSKDLELITKMNQEFAKSLDLKETLNNSLELIIKRINAQAANIFLIDDKSQSFHCIASKHQAYLEDFEIPITIASKLVYSEIGNVFLTRLSSIIHPPRANDERTGMLALRASVIQGINIGDGKINLIKFFEGYPTKTVILDVNALSKVMNKVESISELLDFFTNSPLEKIKSN